MRTHANPSAALGARGTWARARGPSRSISTEIGTPIASAALGRSAEAVRLRQVCAFTYTCACAGHSRGLCEWLTIRARGQMYVYM